MKFVCIGRNYAKHIKELNNVLIRIPLIFMKPSTAFLDGANGSPFFWSPMLESLHYETEVIVKICKRGKNVSAKDAPNHY